MSASATTSTGANFVSYLITTKNKFDKLSITWTIEDARFHFSKSLKSGSFYSADRTLEFCLTVDKTSQFLRVSLELLKGPKWSSVSADYTVSILKSDGTKVNTREGPIMRFETSRFTHTNKTIIDGNNSTESYIKVSDLLSNKALLPNGSLTLFCEVNALLGSDSEVGTVQNYTPSSESNVRMQQQLSLFKAGKFSDVIIEVEGRELRAHKFMLAAQSSVFDAMFASNMLEGSRNRIVITELAYEDVERMLEYIYTGNVTGLPSMADRLLNVADKYALEPLRAMCEETLCQKLSVNNAIKLLSLAELHNAKQLKTRAAQFINHNIAAVQATPDWTDMTTKYSIVLHNFQTKSEK